jgi:hypothetical protein
VVFVVVGTAILLVVVAFFQVAKDDAGNQTKIQLRQLLLLTEHSIERRDQVF